MGSLQIRTSISHSSRDCTPLAHVHSIAVLLDVAYQGAKRTTQCKILTGFGLATAANLFVLDSKP